MYIYICVYLYVHILVNEVAIEEVLHVKEGYGARAYTR